MTAISSSAFFAQAPASDWIADTMAAIKQQSVQGGILGALASSRDGSVRSFLGKGASIANSFALIAQGSVSNSSAFYAQLAAQNDQRRADEVLQKTFAALSESRNRVKPENVLDKFIYFSDGSTIDTENNIMTRPDGTQYDTVTGAVYVDPASLIQMANGAYLNTKTNILTMPDGTQIDTVTGLKVSDET
jgi:hypothetical protein